MPRKKTMVKLRSSWPTSGAARGSHSMNAASGTAANDSLPFTKSCMAYYQRRWSDHAKLEVESALSLNRVSKKGDTTKLQNSSKCVLAGATAPDCAIAQLRERIRQSRSTRSTLHSQLYSSLASVGEYLELGALLLDPAVVLTLERLQGH